MGVHILGEYFYLLSDLLGDTEVVQPILLADFSCDKIFVRCANMDFCNWNACSFSNFTSTRYAD